jgi:hypothetical protein
MLLREKLIVQNLQHHKAFLQKSVGILISPYTNNGLIIYNICLLQEDQFLTMKSPHFLEAPVVRACRERCAPRSESLAGQQIKGPNQFKLLILDNQIVSNYCSGVAWRAAYYYLLMKCTQKASECGCCWCGVPGRGREGARP